MRQLRVYSVVWLLFIASACSGAQVADATAPSETLESTRYEVFGMD